MHCWIDLMFGCKNSGEEAERADNVFYPLCYEGNVDLDKISDLNERYALEVQISEFGQVPKQIFRRPHPARYTALPAAVHCSTAPSVKTGAASPPWPRIRRLVRLGDHQTHREGVSALQILGKDVVVSASHDSNVRLYSSSTASIERSFSARSITISSIVCPGRDSLILACWDNSILVYSVTSATMRSSLASAHQDAVSCLAWAGGTLASGSWDGTIKLWRSEAATDFTVRLEGLVCALDHGAAVTCLSLALEGEAGSLAAGTREGEVWVWSRAGTGWALAHRLPSHSRQVNCVALSPGQDRILSGGSDFQLKLFDLRTGAVVFRADLGQEVTCLAWDGRAALVVGGRGELGYWDLEQGREAGRWGGGHQGRVTALVVGEGAGLVATGGEDRRVVLWRPEV